jgi:predicted DNA-binding WGR domain protein
MNALHLRRIDPARNMSRFYRLDVQPDLFGGVLLVKEWGRIDQCGRMVRQHTQTQSNVTPTKKRL